MGIVRTSVEMYFAIFSVVHQKNLLAFQKNILSLLQYVQ